MVETVLQRAGEAAHTVDDLAESLAIFDLKLRHMREVTSHKQQEQHHFAWHITVRLANGGNL